MAAARAAVRSTFSFQERRYSRDASGSRNARLSETVHVVDQCVRPVQNQTVMVGLPFAVAIAEQDGCLDDEFGVDPLALVDIV